MYVTVIYSIYKLLPCSGSQNWGRRIFGRKLKAREASGGFCWVRQTWKCETIDMVLGNKEGWRLVYFIFCGGTWRPLLIHKKIKLHVNQKKSSFFYMILMILASKWAQKNISEFLKENKKHYVYVCVSMFCQLVSSMNLWG